MGINTVTAASAITPVVVSTFFLHFIHKKSRAQKPTFYLSYDEGLNLVREFLIYASQNTIEELQHFTSRCIPHPYWLKVDLEVIPEHHLKLAAESIKTQLGPDGVEKVGGRTWWQWRKPGSEKMCAEWIEMRDHFNARQEGKMKGNRVMLYVHGGAYYFGSADEHRYQLQRHARLIRARVFAPRYRLAPQFPFPCGLQDCLSAYLYLISIQDPSTILLAGDSAGGGMILSMMIIMRDQNIPLPAGAILISPWLDLTHSFPSVAADNPLDFIPPHGFHHKPSESWPPPVIEDISGTILKKPSGQNDKLSVMVNGKLVEISEQIQMYTPNHLISHPLVSPVMQPSLGGLPPLLMLVGGGEMLRDEQIYVAHKAARPAKYPPRNKLVPGRENEKLNRWEPTQVQLQVWDDFCHVVTTLSFTSPAKVMFRSIAQFSTWALARAQNMKIEVFASDGLSTDPKSDSGTGFLTTNLKRTPINNEGNITNRVGEAGDDLPPFEDNMIRQRVDIHGNIFSLRPESELEACNMKPSEIGSLKEIPARRWLDARREWDNKFASSKRKTQKRVKEIYKAHQDNWQDENPPLTALVCRSNATECTEKIERTKSIGMSMWTQIGCLYDKKQIQGTAMTGKKKFIG